MAGKYDDAGGSGAGPATHPVARFAAAVRLRAAEVAQQPVSGMSARETGQSLKDIDAAIASLSALKARTLKHAETVGVGEEDAAVSTVGWLSNHTNCTRRAAGEMKRLGDGMERWGEVGAALERGEMLPEQAKVIIKALDDLPKELGTEVLARAEKHLVEAAREFDAKALKVLGRHILEVAAPEVADEHAARQLEKEEQEARARTALRIWDNGDGTASGRFTVPILYAHMLRRLLEAIMNASFKSGAEGQAAAAEAAAAETATADAEQPGERGTADGEAHGGGSGGEDDWVPPVDPEATGVVPWDRHGCKRVRATWVRMGEAFLTLLERIDPDRLPQQAGTNPVVVVMMTLETLRGGLETAITDTGLELSPGEARRLACEAGIVPAVLGGKSEVLDLGRKRRLFSKAQRLAMTVQQKGFCAVEGCDRTASSSHAHHRRPWSKGGRTDLKNGLGLCWSHHTKIHLPVYEVVHVADHTIRLVRRRD